MQHETVQEWMKDIRSTPQFRRYERRSRWGDRVYRPLRAAFGPLVATFWSSLIREGVRGTLKPRWGTLTFAFLNDGVKPTVWHTVHTATHRQHIIEARDWMSDFDDRIHDDYLYCNACRIFPRGAPRNREEANA